MQSLTDFNNFWTIDPQNNQSALLELSEEDKVVFQVWTEPPVSSETTVKLFFPRSLKLSYPQNFNAAFNQLKKLKEWPKSRLGINSTL